jgi:NNP family nitrate/nitrite transporter-like MFS transporter
MAATLLISGITTVLLGVASGGWIALVILIQSAAVNSFFPSGFAALSRIAHPSLRSVSNAMGPPIAFVLGGGLLPSLIGFMAQTYSFAAGIMLAGVFMLVGPVLVAMLKLGAFDNAAGC